MCRLLSIISVIFVLFGCGKPPMPTVTVLESSPSGTIYEIPVEQVKDKQVDPPAGKEVDDVVAVVIVPPSEKPTTVQVYRKQKSVMKQAKEIITGDKGSPDIAVASNNPSVKIEATRETGLWPWIAGFGVFAAGLFAARAWLKRFLWFWKILTAVKKLIGL